MNDTTKEIINMGILNLIAIASFMIGGCTGVEIMQKKAVEKGFAKWVPDSNGDTDFVWSKNEQ